MSGDIRSKKKLTLAAKAAMADAAMSMVGMALVTAGIAMLGGAAWAMVAGGFLLIAMNLRVAQRGKPKKEG